LTQNSKYIRWFKELNKDSLDVAGGKGANLGEMYNKGFPIPPGFVVTADAYWDFIISTDLKSHITDILEGLDVNDNVKLQDVANQIQKSIIKQKMPIELKRQIVKAYLDMSGRAPELNVPDSKKPDLLKMSRDKQFIAVRSSATAEDLPEASFAGQQATFLNIKGDEAVAKAVQACWASLFTSRAIFYRETNNFPHMKVKIAVVVQKMVDAEKAGVAFSSDPSTGAPEIMIEAGWGLGDTVVAGEINPDRYLVDKNSFEITTKEIKKQTKMKIKDPLTGKTIVTEVPDKKKEAQIMTDEEIIELSKMIKKIDEHYQKPQDIEWAIERGRIYIVQSRAITTIKKDGPKPKEGAAKPQGDPVLKGLGASPGMGSGIVKLIKDKSELERVKQGDVIVTKMTDPDMVPAMKRAAAIVTDEGGMTCHAAIVSREMGIPAIVGTEKATTTLKDNDEITADGTSGFVYMGLTKIEEKKPEQEIGFHYEAPVTATRVYMNLGAPEKIDEYKNLPFDGIGLMREEFIVASEIGEHPNALIEKGEESKFVDKLIEGVTKVASAVNPRPVILRFSDFKTNEYHDLKGGDKFEPKENNPMIGWRGCSRYISSEFEKAFRLECEVVRKVRTEKNLLNLWVMLPFVRNTWEVKKILQIMKEEGLERSKNFKVLLMAEVPSIIFLADEFAKLCDGFSIGSNDLTQLVLGVDRDSAKLAKMGYFDERNLAVKRAIEYLVKKAHENGVPVGICGQAPSVFPDFTEFLVDIGIDSISVSPDVVVKTRSIIASFERKMLLEKVRNIEREVEGIPKMGKYIEAYTSEPKKEVPKFEEKSETFDEIPDFKGEDEEESPEEPLEEKPKEKSDDLEYFDFSELNDI